MRSIALLGWLAIWGLGCGDCRGDSSGEPAPRAFEASEPAEKEGPVGVEVEVPPATPGQRRMHDRYGRVEGVRDALVAGDLSEAQSVVRGLDQAVEIADLPPEAAGLRDAVPSRAQALLAADSVASASRAFAQVMLACGQCHRAAGVDWRFDDPVLPEGDAIEAHMARHAWAVERMWEGLMLGDPDRFDEGARRFVEAPLTGEDPVDEADEHPAGLSALARRVHRRARAAPEAPDLTARGAIYGDLLGDCADCHTRIQELDRQGGRPPE